MDFWKRVKEEIKRQNTTQDWVASKIPVRQDTFSRWIQRNTMPNVDQAGKIASALGVTIEYLLTGEKQSKWTPPPRYADIIEDLAIIDETGLTSIRDIIAGCKGRLQKEIEEKQERENLA